MPLFNNLEMKLRLNDTPGSVWLDDTINHNNLGEEGGNPLSVNDHNGTANSAAEFNGTSHYLEIDDADVNGLDITGNMFMGCWFKTNALSSFHQGIMGKWNGTSSGQAGYLVFISHFDSKIYYLISNAGTGSTNAVSSITITAGVWYHVMCVFDGSLYIYINNALVAGPIAHSGGIFDTPAAFRVGAFNSLSPVNVFNFFNGSIDDVVVGSGTLSAANRAIIYGAGSDFGNVIFPNTVAQYKLNETSGNVWNDSTIFKNHLTEKGTTLPLSVTGHGGLSNKAVGFKQSLRQYLMTPSRKGVEITRVLSISCWFKTETSSSFQCLVSKYDASHSEGRSYRLCLSSTNKIFFIVSDDGSSTTVTSTASSIATGVWYHVVGVYNGTNIQIYLNGVADGISVPHSTDIFNSTTPFRVGAWGGTANVVSNFMDGAIDDVMMWSKALTAAEVALVYALNDDFVSNYELNARNISKTPTTLVEIITDTVPDTVQQAATLLLSEVGKPLHIENPTTAKPFLISDFHLGQEIRQNVTQLVKYVLNFKDDFEQDGSSFFRKWVTANPYYYNRILNIKKGFEGFSESEYETVFKGVMKDIEFHGNGTFSITVKGIMALLEKDYPSTTDGEVGLEMSASDTALVLKTGTDMDQYPFVGYVKVKSKKINEEDATRWELIKYTSITNTTLNTSLADRGQFSSDNPPNDGWGVKAVHEVGENVQYVMVFNNKNPIDIIQSLLAIGGLDKGSPLGEGDLDNGSTGSFNYVKNTFFLGVMFRVFLDEPTKISEILRRLREQTFTTLHQNRNGQIAISYLAPKLFNSAPKTITDAGHIIYHSNSFKDRMDLQITRMTISYGLLGGLSGSDVLDYRYKSTFKDSLRETNYKDIKSKNIKSQFIRNDLGGRSYVKRIAKHNIRVFGDGRRTFIFSLETKDENLEIGDVFILNTDQIQAIDGTVVAGTKYYVTSKTQVDSNKFTYEAYDSKIKHRIAYIGPAVIPSTPDYPEASAREREYFYISNSLGELGNDNSKVSARYKLSDTPGGLWIDDTAHNINLTEAGGSPATTADRNGTAGNAVLFDGTQFLKATNPAMLRFLRFNNHFTLSCWFLLDALSSTQSLLSKDALWSSGSRGWHLYVSVSNTLVLRVSKDGLTYTSTTGATVLSTGVWYHVMGVYDGVKLYIYLNGVLDGSVNYTDGVFDNNIDFRIGASGDGSDIPDNYLTGRVDDVIIWHKALNTTQRAVAFAQTSEFGIQGDDGYYFF